MAYKLKKSYAYAVCMPYALCRLRMPATLSIILLTIDKKHQLHHENLANDQTRQSVAFSRIILFCLL